MASERIPLVSVIIPIYNGEKWINPCFQSILEQDILGKELIEISVYNDCSSDDTLELLNEWQETLTSSDEVRLVVSTGETGSPKGVGFAKNKAVKQSSGTYLCFQDVDDIMLPSRISKQLELAWTCHDAIIGCQVKRAPENSTKRFITWANGLSHDLLTVQIFTSHGPTVLMPTWFFHSSVFKRVGGFSEEGKGIPEDLIFFYHHLDKGGQVMRVDEVLVIYTYHMECTTFSVLEETIWKIRVSRLERDVLSQWSTFTIWNAGKQGRRLYRSLTDENRAKVVEFCDVDVKKMGNYYEPYCKLVKRKGVKVPIVHFTAAKPPMVVCVKMDLTNGEFERNLSSMNLVEGRDYVMFS